MALKLASLCYETVRDILDAAAGDTAEDYGGAGAFWRDGPEALRGARVHGVAMVSATAEASGLIRGLRGQAPFDGSRFPRLPWGGSPVADEDIALIAAWIDAGCPGDGDGQAQVELGVLEAEGHQIEWLTFGEVAEFEAVEGGINLHEFRQPETRQRGNIDCISEAEIETVREAFRAMYDLNTHAADRRNYNNQALIHQNHCQHGWERFLPWHRAYLYEFEQNMRDLVPNVMLPYWDWTMPQYCPDTPEEGDLIPKRLMAYLTHAEAETLIKRLDPKPDARQAKAIMAMADTQRLFRRQAEVFLYLINEVGYTELTPLPEDCNRQAVIDALYRSNPLWYPLRYPAEYYNSQYPLPAGGKMNQVIQYHYPRAEDMEQILSLNNFRDFGGGSMYNDSFGFLDQNPHNTMHIWTGGMNPYHKRSSYTVETKEEAESAAKRSIGSPSIRGRSFHTAGDLYSQPQLGDMFSNLTAAYDPVFWPIHANVDRNWWLWQQMHPDAAPLDLDAVLTPWSYTLRDMQSIEPFGYEYVRGGYLMPVGLDAPIGKFTSKPIKVPKKLGGQFKSAEIRLQRVPQLSRSCFVRAFLNDPDAGAHTPIRGNPNFAGYLAIFGHGSCYGGPGHCALPPPRARAADQRPRHHNTPRNHRIDVTDAVRHALEKGDTVQITLVVIGANYQQEDELLKLEGVTLTFLD